MCSPQTRHRARESHTHTHERSRTPFTPLPYYIAQNISALLKHLMYILLVVVVDVVSVCVLNSAFCVYKHIQFIHTHMRTPMLHHHFARILQTKDYRIFHCVRVARVQQQMVVLLGWTGARVPGKAAAAAAARKDYVCGVSVRACVKCVV